MHLQDILIPAVTHLLPLFTYFICVIGKEFSYFFKNMLRDALNLLVIFSFQFSFSNANWKFYVVSSLICFNSYLWTIFCVLTCKFSCIKIWPLWSDRSFSAGRSWKLPILLWSKNKFSISQVENEPVLVGYLEAFKAVHRNFDSYIK